ncbi:hypothetical protein Gohar_005708 [Gossypium harknessii]|uniref:Uncharacterized protein n=1 Tax=Gossypium harknessii TaxID=34285 RepID=A0A7J9H9F4_9ROSI|nr:hypothetical protein [Gossypium harknessii]
MAPRFISLWHLCWNRLDNCSSRAFLCKLAFFPLLILIHKSYIFLVCCAWICIFLPQVTYHFFHWKKGTPFADDQGIYNGLTWWEQIDNGKQLTRNRKFLTVVPVVL